MAWLMESAIGETTIEVPLKQLEIQFDKSFQVALSLVGKEICQLSSSIAIVSSSSEEMTSEFVKENLFADFEPSRECDASDLCILETIWIESETIEQFVMKLPPRSTSDFTAKESSFLRIIQAHKTCNRLA